MSEHLEKKSASEKKREDWMNAKWRPMMGWIYMATCITDFILFPVMWSLAQTILKQPLTPWQPITLQGAGLFHVAMGAIIGISAFGRTQEKLAGANNGGLTVPGVPTNTMPTAPMPNQPMMPSSVPMPSYRQPMQQPMQQQIQPSVNTQPVYSGPTVFVSSTGKPGPVPPPDPEI